MDRGGKVKGTSAMAIELPRLRTSDGQTISIQTDAFERRAEELHHNDAAKVGGAAAVGAIIGAIAGGGKGAAIGAGVGGGAGAGDVLLTRGKPVTFPQWPAPAETASARRPTTAGRSACSPLAPASPTARPASGVGPS